MKVAEPTVKSKSTWYLWILKAPLLFWASGFCFFAFLIFNRRLDGVSFENSPERAFWYFFACIYSLVCAYIIIAPRRLTPSRWRCSPSLRRKTILACLAVGSFLGYMIVDNADRFTWMGFFGPFVGTVLALRWWWEDDSTSWPYQLGLMAAWCLLMLAGAI